MIGQLNDLYSNTCESCGGTIVEDLADDEDWDAIYRQITEDLLNNADYKINTDLHLKTAKKLIDAVNKGFGETSFADDEDRKRLATALQRNIYAFSSAKSFSQMKYYRDMMIGDDGSILGFNSYKKRIADAGEIFNSTFLRAEYENAYYSAIMADKWQNLNTEYLEYSTVGDRRVRPEHQALDRFTAAKEHPVWRRIYPPNGWNCRCTVIPGKAHLSEKTMLANDASKMMKPLLKDTPFDNNVGISEVIFKDNHPYFKNVNGRIAEMTWKEYGLSSAQKIQLQSGIPELKITTKNEYIKWWDSKKNSGEDIVVKDVLGQEIRLKGGDSKDDFKNHIIHEFDKKKSENRFEFATESLKILTDPDEVWLSKEDGNTRNYIKYYENQVIKLVVKDNHIAESVYILDDEKYSGATGKARKGLLMFKK